jgi:putative transposase
MELLLEAAPRLCLADAAYDSDALRAALLARGNLPVVLNNPTRKRQHPFDRGLYRLRNAVGRLKGWRTRATRYDKLACNSRRRRPRCGRSD